jgi:hypothetical protein
VLRVVDDVSIDNEVHVVTSSISSWVFAGVDTQVGPMLVLESVRAVFAQSEKNYMKRPKTSTILDFQRDKTTPTPFKI